MLQTQAQDLIDPYVFNSELIKEQQEDEALEYVKELCKDYISFTNEFPELYSPDDILNSYRFINERIQELYNIRNSFGLTTHKAPFTHIGHGMDLITVQDKLRPLNTRSIYYELSTQIDLTLEVLDFCKIILEKIIYTPKER